MERLKEKIERLKESNETLLNETLGQAGMIQKLVAENTRLKEQADRVGLLIAKNVKLENRLVDLKDQVDEMVEVLS